MRIPLLLADFIHARAYRPKCEKFLTRPCSSHRIHEKNLDTMVWEYLTAVRDSRVKEREKLVKLQKMWALRKPVLDAHILSLQKRIQELEQEIDAIVMGKYIYRQID